MLEEYTFNDSWKWNNIFLVLILIFFKMRTPLKENVKYA